MPALASSGPPSTILVTGASGFIATWIVGTLLERGYKVRAAVRAEARGKHLLETYKEYSDKLELHVVGDIKDGTLDEAVKGVEGIIHAASPLHLSATHPKGIIDSAVNSVVGMLNSALKHGSSLRRIIYTSSILTCLNTEEGPATISEADWNELPVTVCEQKGEATPPVVMYTASKILAEKAAWDFYKKHKSNVEWDLAMINPPWVFGPPRQAVTTVDTLNLSNLTLYNVLVKGNFLGVSPLVGPAPGHGWMDVRDVAEAHVRALEVPAAGGERILVLVEPMVWQDWLDVANSLSPPPYPHDLPKGTPGTVQRNITFDTSKEKRILGIKHRTMRETARDILTDYAVRGW